MIKSFITSFKLKNTYRVNCIIYSLKQLPIIKKLLPASLYQNRKLKTFANIISTLGEIGSVFIWKLLYILVMIVLAISIYKTNEANIFLHLFTFLTLCGGLLNTVMFDPSKDKYYAMIIMHMDAKEYTLSNYYYVLLKMIVGLMPFTIVFGLYYKVPLWICLVLPIFVVMVKMTVSNYCLWKYNKTKKYTNENLPQKAVWSVTAILLAIAYGLPAIGITINATIFLALFIIAVALGIYSFRKINNFAEYEKMYRQILINNKAYIYRQETSTQVLKETVSKQIEFDKDTQSNKTGFAYFHDLFVKRHRKILTKATKKQAMVIFVILIAGIIAIFVNNNIKETINNIMLTYLPYFVFIMYLLNRGTTVTQAMFMNCDHSMLSFRIYRTPKVILGIFKERLKTLITINLLPATIIAIGLPTLLFLSGGTDNILNYLILFVSIIAMSIFFSVHYLIMYYLLQPYNISTEIKSSTYIAVQTITYLVCYYFIRVKLSTMYFGIAMTIFCVLYSIISLVLVYKYAPKTFKLRM